jgi:hypothetical protein
MTIRGLSRPLSRVVTIDRQAVYTSTASVQQVGVNHGPGQITMAEELASQLN